MSQSPTTLNLQSKPKPAKFIPRAFNPPRYLQNGHIQSILPKFIRQNTPKYQRQWHLDSTGRAVVAYDFVNLHGADKNKPLAVMFCGLEGGSGSHYAKTFANWASKLGYCALIVHYRGCGGMPNLSDKDYHGGDSAEIAFVIDRLACIYPKMVAVGVSLGGNMLAKYLGEYPDNPLLSAVVVSVPVDLTSSAQALKKPIARRLYTPYLLKTLIPKALAKTDDSNTIERLKKIKTLDEFDDIYTAPRHGYGTCANYYKKASALPKLINITTKTLIISSDDDPFLGKVAQAYEVADCVQLLYTPYGGHVGFVAAEGGLTLDWLPRTIFDFVDYVVDRAN